MSFPYLTRLKSFSSYLAYFSGKPSVRINFYRYNHFKKHRLLKQQVNVNVILSKFYRSTHIDSVKLGDVKISSDFDPDLQEFNNSYELVRKALCLANDEALVDAIDWSAKVLDYNVQGGKKNRGVTVLKAFKILLEEEISSDKISQACILGWCVEMLQGFFVMCDDIMDNSTIRRGKPCWYKMSDVGLIAVNDSLLLEHGIYKILKFYFQGNKAYNSILHEFLQNTQKTVYGQCLDMLCISPNTKHRFENFNLKKYHAIVKYKTSYYTFCLPVHLAMHLVGNFTEKEFEDTRNICMKLGLLFQIQDDYLDIFGDPTTTGKVGTDIIDGKCTWFSAYYFEHAPESMKKLMMENYGVNSENAVSQVMNLYKELNLEEKYRECEESLMREISLLVNNLPRDSLQELFHKLLKKLYQRNK